MLNKSKQKWGFNERHWALNIKIWKYIEQKWEFRKQIVNHINIKAKLSKAALNTQKKIPKTVHKVYLAIIKVKANTWSDGNRNEQPTWFY